MEHAYKSTVDGLAFAVLALAVCPPVFLAAYSGLSGDLLGVLVGAALELISAAVIVWPFLFARYTLSEKGLAIRYWRTVTIPYESMTEVKRVDGHYKIGLSGFGYYCTNFRRRVLVRTKKGGIVLSPDDVDAFVLGLRERLGGARAG